MRSVLQDKSSRSPRLRHTLRSFARRVTPLYSTSLTTDMAVTMDTNVPDLSTAAALRKIRKPLVERKRRERINSSMDQLKSLVLQALNKNEAEFDKMEKADILEMTVHYMRNLQKPRPVPSPVQRPVLTSHTVQKPVQSAVHRPVPTAAVLPVPHPALRGPATGIARDAGVFTAAEETRTYLSRVRPELAERAYDRLSQLLTVPAPPRKESKDVTKPRGLKQLKQEAARRFLSVDPSLTKPISVVVPEDRRKPVTPAVWRPF